jgi:hypothetical protein
MKKFLAVILAFALTPAFAQHHHGGYGGGSNWVAPLIIGGLVGAAIARPASPPPPVYYAPPQPQVYNITPQYTTCLIQVYDPYTGTYRNEVVNCVR